MNINLTEKAIERVKTYVRDQAVDGSKGFRVYVEGGGCSGYSYGFSLDEPQEGDTVLEKEGIKVIVDPSSVRYLDDAIVDFVETLGGAGFVVQNPNAQATCGCGTSFSVGDGAPQDTGSCSDKPR